MTDKLAFTDNDAALMEALSPAARLALAYAPARARRPTLALLALDARLAGLLRHSREPMLAQLRLAWWREALSADAGSWPKGEPLFAAFASWDGAHGGLAALVEGWEQLTGPAPLPAQALLAMATGRAEAFGALAGVLNAGDAQIRAARQRAQGWALADLALHLSHPAERDAADALVVAASADRPRLGRALRPLAVLDVLARRRLAGQSEGALALLATLRAGLTGR